MEVQRDVTRDLSDVAAEEIRALLGRRRISQAELARRMHVTGAWLNYRLTGRQPIDLNDLQAIASVLGVAPVQLLGIVGAAKVTAEQVRKVNLFSRSVSRPPAPSDSSTRPTARRSKPSSRPSGTGGPGSYPHSGRRPSLIGYHP